ncbi:hypothetical protein Q4603_05655 [Zobellia galactanivorans]|uniref:hypothetical protein n=1 Tax=Zobellia galactanivorans (strain DSM 12802 / CCUG 47099 / CIP 106680 / NCIMB 13871 / Dsij) TaxID=63186 RepID=UPI0026E1F229|nr:hypothetical protein [Zobellia galactanivorans]MDO6808080.1 hypothetical protein [Zobellia galactanivorans]
MEHLDIILTVMGIAIVALAVWVYRLSNKEPEITRTETDEAIIFMDSDGYLINIVKK